MREQPTPEPVVARIPSESGDAASEKPDTPVDEAAPKSRDFIEEQASGSTTNVQQPTAGQDARTRRGAQAKGPEPFSQAERDEMEKLLEELRGHLGGYFCYSCHRCNLTLFSSIISYPFS